ncbi:unnamed protein product [Peniophora sp. CBMAI 1063]|nr:unnamed protein product [Peniophora sp. CBMAI 1063]
MPSLHDDEDVKECPEARAGTVSSKLARDDHLVPGCLNYADGAAAPRVKRSRSTSSGIEGQDTATRKRGRVDCLVGETIRIYVEDDADDDEGRVVDDDDSVVAQDAADVVAHDERGVVDGVDSVVVHDAADVIVHDDVVVFGHDNVAAVVSRVAELESQVRDLREALERERELATRAKTECEEAVYGEKVEAARKLLAEHALRDEVARRVTAEAACAVAERARDAAVERKTRLFQQMTKYEARLEGKLQRTVEELDRERAKALRAETTVAELQRQFSLRMDGLPEGRFASGDDALETVAAIM